ncbi:MAG TPA: DUF3305 domain-containing protein, partial [Sulfitobacter sp.]|nr:DUF3305 domain-containing protein [Sulfitobacter sp.]
MRPETPETSSETKLNAPLKSAQTMPVGV